MKNPGTLLIVLLMLALGAHADASVVIDNFDGTASSFVGSGAVTRDLDAGATVVTGGIRFAPQSTSSLTYTVSDPMGTFGDLDPSFANGVAFATSSSSASSDFEIALYADGNLQGSYQAIDSGEIKFEFDLSGVKSLKFYVLGCTNGDHFGEVGGSLSAVPEPTSLILVGIACTATMLRRRRIAFPSR